MALPSKEGFLDFFLYFFGADPCFFVGLEFDEFEVNLIEFDGGSVFGIEDGFDTADEHEISSCFSSHLFAGFGAGPVLLFFSFCAELAAFVGIGNKDDASAVGEFAFEVFDEGAGLDVFGA